jgi:acetyltransferase-like isoleucine patch superfamily enzyme
MSELQRDKPTTSDQIPVSDDYRSLQALLNTPWRISNELRRRVLVPLVRLQFATSGIHYGEGWRILGMPILQRHRQSSIRIGDYFEMRSWYRSNPLIPNHPVVLATRKADAEIIIGNHCGFTGSVIVAAQRVQIGDRVLLGANVVVMDTDFHPLHPDQRRVDTMNANHAPVIIEDDVFIGMNAMILKGVRIGAGSTIGAGSVVAKDIPPRSLAAGNPARVIRSLDER